MEKAYNPSATLLIEIDLLGHLLPLQMQIEIDAELAKIIKENKPTNARFIIAEKSTFGQLVLPNNNPAILKKAG